MLGLRVDAVNCHLDRIRRCRPYLWTGFWTSEPSPFMLAREENDGRDQNTECFFRSAGFIDH
jgi:hypothetical protein